MKQHTINLYDFNELSDEAKIKALEEHNDKGNDFWFLEDNLSGYLIELLEKNGIKGDAKLQYSLNYCQGDGVSFTGNFEYKGININVSHDNGHYYHSNSVYIEAEIDEDDSDELRNDAIEVLSDDIETEFKEIFKEICDKVEKCGYEEIEYNQSEENFKDLCEMNEYTFEVNGEMRNE